MDFASSPSPLHQGWGHQQVSKHISWKVSICIERQYPHRIPSYFYVLWMVEFYIKQNLSRVQISNPTARKVSGKGHLQSSLTIQRVGKSFLSIPRANESLDGWELNFCCLDTEHASLFASKIKSNLKLIRKVTAGVTKNEKTLAPGFVVSTLTVVACYK